MVQVESGGFGVDLYLGRTLSLSANWTRFAWEINVGRHRSRQSNEWPPLEVDVARRRHRSQNHSSTSQLDIAARIT